MQQGEAFGKIPESNTQAISPAGLMRNNALYFPYIDVPNESWTLQTLLYWDKLSSIVPADHLGEPDQMGGFMRALLAEGLVEPVLPGRFIRRIPDFDESFIRLVDARRHKALGLRKEAPGQWTRIHAEKLGRIPDYLVDLGLAHNTHYPWYDIQTPIANLFMAYLAICLGEVSGVNATPVTNKALFAAALGQPRKHGPATHTLHHQKARDVALKALLPLPQGGLTLDKLVKFKQKHGHLLPPLRARIEQHCARVALMASPEEREHANAAFVLDCQDKIAEIEEAMRTSWNHFVLGSLVPLAGAGFALQGTPAGYTAVYAGAALSLAGAAYQAISSITGRRAAQDFKPLAYFAHVRRAI